MNIPFRARLIISLSVLVALVVGLGLSALTTFQAIQENYKPLGPDVIPGILFLLETKSDLMALEAALERTVATGDNTYIVRAQQLVPQILKAASNHSAQESPLGETDQQTSQQIEEDITHAIELFDQIAETSQQPQAGITRQMSPDIERAKLDVVINRLTASINSHLSLHMMEIENALQTIDALISRSVRNLLVGTILAPILAFAIAFVVIRMVITPVGELEKGARQFAAGNLSHRIRFSNERDIFNRLATAFNDMADAIVQRESDLKTANLNLEEIVSERTKRTEQALHEAEIAYKALEKQIWITTALSRLNEHIRGDIGLYSIAANVVREICEQINAQVGVIYLINNDSPDPYYEIGASYAYKPQPDRPTQFQVGEGLLGQVARDKKTICLDQEAIHNLRVTSGMGSSIPMSTVIAPMVFNDQVIAVFEAASIHTFAPNYLEYLNSALEAAAIAFHTAQVRGQIDDLLVKTRQQAARLRNFE